MEIAKIQHICKESFIKNGFTYFEKGKVYLINKKKNYFDGDEIFIHADGKPGYISHSQYTAHLGNNQIFDMDGNLLINIVEDLLSRYFQTMAEFRDVQIDSILKD